VVVPVSQAIVGDLTHRDGAAAAHGFGMVAGTFGLGLCVGPLLGGWLTGMHRPAACFSAAGERLHASCTQCCRCCCGCFVTCNDAHGAAAPQADPRMLGACVFA
jgi:hypothetical protein